MSAYDRSITAATSRAAETMSIEVRFVTSLMKFGDRPRFAKTIDVPAETSVGDLIAIYQIPLDQIARVLCNGRDMNPGTYTGGNLDLGASISDGDVITFCGPSPAIPGTRSAVV